MRIYPAIDLHGGRCVRLKQGDLNQETVFSDDPSAMARQWAEQGAEWLHVVDLDGSFGGNPANVPAIEAIVSSVRIPVQLGGGLRSLEQIRAAFAAGVQRAIIGTAAYENPALVREACDAFPGRVAVGVDARDGFVAIRGWKVVTDRRTVDFAFEMQSLGASLIIHTDIGRDGILEGPNLEATRELAQALEIPVIASGGVSSLDDLRALANIADAGIDGVIVGRALYDGKFTFAEAIRAVSATSRV